MATAYPFVDAYEDSSIGLNGGHNRMPWISVIDEAGDDPYLPVYEAAPIGAAHPLPRFSGLVVVGYDTAQLLGGPDDGLTYKVYVNYGPASDRTIGLWRRSVRFASETRRLTHSLPEYYDNGKLKTPRRRIGNPVYDPISFPSPTIEDPQRVEYVKSKTGLYQLKRDRDAFVPDYVQISSGLTAFMYDILVPQISAKKIRQLSAALWSTNKVPFLGYPAWSLQFSNYAIDDEVLAFPGNRGTTAVWYSNVSMEILHEPIDNETNPYGFRATTRQDEWVRDNGSVVPVYEIKEGREIPVTQTIIRYPETDFSSLFGIIGYPAPAV